MTIALKPTSHRCRHESGRRSSGPRVRPVLHRSHGHDPVGLRPRLARRPAVPYAPLEFDPATMALHYGQEIFEGLKAYRQPDGSVATFRPDMNARRFQQMQGY